MKRFESVSMLTLFLSFTIAVDPVNNLKSLNVLEKRNDIEIGANNRLIGYDGSDLAIDKELLSEAEKLFPALKVKPYKSKPDEECQLITLSLCKHMLWNMTTNPNLLGHANQQHTSRMSTGSAHLQALFHSNCSFYIQQLICGFLVPLCSNGVLVPPCLSFCLSIRQSCPLLADTPINCNLLSNDEPCLGSQGNVMYSLSRRKPIPTIVQCSNPAPPGYSLQLADGTIIEQCGLPCDLSVSDKWWSMDPSNARKVITAMSLICLLLSTFTMLTYFVDRDRFRYPERSIIYICMCFIPISTCYLISNGVIVFRVLYRFAHSLSISCEYKTRLLAQGSRNVGCSLLFLFTYMPWLFSNMWFVILSLTWMLTSVFIWSHEAIIRWRFYFHAMVWILPLMLAVYSLSTGSISVNPLTGICWPIQTTQNYRYLIILPHTVYLTTGSVFLLIGFVSLFKTRNGLRFLGKRTEDLERLMFRVGVIALLYLIPSLIVCASNYYAHSMRSKWVTWYVCQQQDIQFNHPCPVSLLKMAERPALEVATLQEVMFLSIGIVVSMWAWNSKTLSSWKSFFFSIYSFIFCRRDYEASV